MAVNRYTFNTPAFRTRYGETERAGGETGSPKRETTTPDGIAENDASIISDDNKKLTTEQRQASDEQSPEAIGQDDPLPIQHASTLIVEQPLQRDDNPMPPNTSGDFVRELPVEATPNVAMPDELQGSDNIQYQPVLDLFRYKTNRYWNQLRFDGKLSPSQQEFIGPVVWIEFPPYGEAIQPPLDTHGSNRRTVNPFSKLLKETITITANPVVFGDTAKEGFNHTNEGLTFNNNIPEGLTTDPNAADAADVSAGFASTILGPGNYNN